MSTKHNREVIAGSDHSFTQFIQAWQYVCAQFSAAEWNLFMLLHNPLEHADAVPVDRIMPVMQPLAHHVKHYDKLAGVLFL